jgi:protein-tyrosine phosphatase
MMIMETVSVPINKSYWVVPGRFRAGEYPGSIQDDVARGKLCWLLEQGIDYFLDLTEPEELKPYRSTLYEEADANNASIMHKHYPIHDLSTPSMERIMEILDAIDLAISDGKNIYLHCFGGKGRTGLVVGCYLARHGMPGVKALQVIQELRKGLPDAAKPSPETDEQIRMVKEWTNGK